MNILKFCGESEKLNLPFTVGQDVYVSDGRMAIKLQSVDLSLKYRDNKYPEATQKIDEFFTKAVKDTPVDFRFENYRDEYIECSICHGLGKLTKCGECNGKGIVECCECGQDRDCPDCDGTGNRSKIDADNFQCGECAGVGKVLKQQETILTDKLKVQSKYLCRIFSELKNVKLYAEHDTSFSKYGFVYFTFENGQGVLLPLIH